MENSKTFTYRDSKNVEHTISFQEGDFSLSQADVKLTDTKLQSKPTTFFKDAMRRFVKNKSSVVGAAILGSIVLLTIFVPIFNTHSLDTSNPNLAYQTKLAPKLFSAGTGFWDGTSVYKNVAIDFDWQAYQKEGTYAGSPATTANSKLQLDAIVGNIEYSKVGEKKISDNIVSYARGGSMRVSASAGSKDDAFLQSPEGTFHFDQYAYTLEVQTSAIPEEGFARGEQGEFSLNFLYRDTASSPYSSIVLQDFGTETGTHVFRLSDNEALASFNGGTSLGKFYLTMKPEASKETSVLVSKVLFSIEGEATESEKTAMSNLSCTDANLTLNRPTVESEKAYAYTSNADLNIFQADYVTGIFRYDSYQAAFGNYTSSSITMTDLQTYQDKGWMNFAYPIESFKNGSMDKAEQTKFIEGIAMTEEGKSHCPLQVNEENPITVRVVKAGKIKTASFTGTMSRYREFGYSSMPRFLFGTDNQGRDMFKLVFNGLRYSIILGVATTFINIVIGLIWGAISGYFGGWTDIAMERVCEILGGIPWVVVMTLILINRPENMSTILMVGIALCTTGWLGTASLTRTQFYRFKDREYILAARTLGASDFRLIFRHILPNAIGTLITSSVLMIPSVIFSEASLSYLGLVNGMEGFGSVLSSNQIYMTTYPYLILFPSVVMALVMISFNLFGNGLRDAFNPSLKGGE